MWVFLSAVWEATVKAVKVSLYAAMSVTASSVAAMAATCGVNPMIIESAEAITLRINTKEELHRERLLAAIKVLTKQVSATDQQTQATIKKSAEANASTLVAQRYRLQVADAKARYSSTGYNPCEFGQTAQGYYQAMKSAPGNQQSIRSGADINPGQWGDPGKWIQRAKAGEKYDAGVIFKGDTAAASDYISFVIGPPLPEIKSLSGTAQDRLRELSRNQTDAYRSASAEILASIAADYAAGGPIEKAKEVANFWIGDDGGMKWAATTAHQHERGAMQDAVRIEAARLATLALRIRTQKRTEFAIATYALAQTNGMVTSGSPDAAGSPLMRKASIEDR